MRVLTRFPTFSLALTLAASTLAVSTLTVSTTASAQDPKPVVVDRVITAEVRSGQRVVGTVNPLRTSVIGSAIDGRVEAFLVKAGDPIKEGQKLAQLRTATLKIEVALAEAELQLYEQKLAELENGSLPEDIAEAEANMRSAEAAYKNADRRVKRLESLEARNAASTADLDDARELAETAKFSLQATQALLKRIKDGPRAEMIAQAKAQVELQKQRLNLAEDRVTKATIVAPFDGFVAEEFTEVGAWITRGDPIARVIEMQEVEIHAPVTAEAAVGLRRGDAIRVEFPELPNELLTGEIQRIVPVASARARTFPVQVRLTNKIVDGSPMLLAGMLARLDIPAGQRELLPLVPKDALVLNGRDRSIFIVERSGENASVGVARRVPVELGVAVKDRIQVRGDIRVGDLVVIVGNERLVPETAVSIVERPSASNN